MENMIKKKEKKGKVTEIVTESSDNGIDPFEEYNRYINQPRLISGRTDDPRRGRMNHVKFGGLQKLRAGYMDGQLSVEDEVMKKYIRDFTFDDDEYSD